MATLGEMQQWIAGRIASGAAVSVARVADQFGLTAQKAQLVMGSNWPQYLAAPSAPQEEPSPPALDPGCPERCPRCRGALIRNYDEALCLIHGTVYTPIRGWDLGSVGVSRADDGTLEYGPTGRRRNRSSGSLALHECPDCHRMMRRFDQESHWMVCVGRPPVEISDVACEVCDGSGDMRERHRAGRPRDADMRVCAACGGLGMVAPRGRGSSADERRARLVAVARLTAERRPLAEIAAEVGCSVRVVLRDRAVLREWAATAAEGV